MFYMPRILVSDSAPDEASEGFGAPQSKTVLRFIGSVRPDRYSMTDALACLVTGHWKGLYNKAKGLLFSSLL